jgi:hypothetical protein
MTGSDDPWGAMARFLSPDPVEQLLAGTSVPGELDASASRVGRLLCAMHSPALPAGPGMEQQAVAAIVDAIREAPRPLAPHRRSRMLTQLMSAKAAVAAATLAALLAGGTAAAAATGSLPGPAQTAVSSALAHVGISVPSPNSHANSHATNNPHRGAPHGGAPDPTGGAKGPDATGNPKYGLCQAWAATPTPNAHSHKHDSVAFANLQEAADAAGMSVADYCKGVTPPTGTGETITTPSTSPGTTPSTVTHAPPVSTPNSGGAHAGSGGASSEGTSNAPPAANAGAANATTHPTGRP